MFFTDIPYEIITFELNYRKSIKKQKFFIYINFQNKLYFVKKLITHS